MRTRPILGAAILAASLWPALATAQVEHGRGNIVAVDHDRGTIDLRDPQGRVGTWQFNRGASVRFTDGRGMFPNPSTRDLRPPMYVHFTFRNEVIDSFEVRELGFAPGNEESANQQKQKGVSRTLTGRLTAYDPSVRQVEVDLGSRRETFQLTNDALMRGLDAGQRVQLRTEWSGQRELVTDLRILGSGDGKPDDPNRGTSATSIGGSQNTVEGRVMRVTPRGVEMRVGGTRQTYSVSNADLLRQLRVGETVTFAYEERDGRLYITDVR
jgi:Cu/Ag efflux protein CusF